MVVGNRLYLKRDYKVKVYSRILVFCLYKKSTNFSFFEVKTVLCLKIS